MGLMLVGCQQTPPATTVVTRTSTPVPVTTSSEHTTASTETTQTTLPTVNPDGSTAAPGTESTKTEHSTSVVTKKE